MGAVNGIAIKAISVRQVWIELFSPKTKGRAGHTD